MRERPICTNLAMTSGKGHYLPSGEESGPMLQLCHGSRCHKWIELCKIDGYLGVLPCPSIEDVAEWGDDPPMVELLHRGVCADNERADPWDDPVWEWQQKEAVEA